MRAAAECKKMETELLAICVENEKNPANIVWKC